MSLLKKIFGDYSSKELKRIRPLKEKVLALEEEYSKLTDDELKAKTPEFKQRLADGETLVAFGDFRLHSCDVYSEHLIPFTRELMERYKTLGADAAMRDEWGFPSPSEDGFRDGRCFWYSPGYAAAYAKRTGRTLADDLIVMAYPAKGDDSLRHRLAGEYMYLNFERNAEIEEDMYATSKRLWGEDCFVTKHPTWYGQLEYHNIWHDGMDWWRAKRDWAQSDEAVPRCALLGMMRKFGGPNWLNEWYSGTPASYHTNIWRYAVAGARMVVHPLFDPQPFKMFPNDPDRANRYYHEPILTPDFVRAEGRIRLLNLMTRGQVASQAAVVFGHKRTINFADKATWLPGESDLGIKNWRTIDWGGGLAADFWKAGYFADLFPSDEFSYGTFTVDADGYICVGTQAYPVVVFTHLDADDVASFEKLTAGKVLKTKAFQAGYTQYVLSNGATVYFRQTDFNPNEILMSAQSKGGTSLYPTSMNVDLKALNDVMEVGGLGNFSVTDLRKVLAGRKLSVTPNVSLFGESISASSTPKDFETMLQVNYLYFTSLRSDQKAFESWKERKKAALANQEKDPMTSLQDSIQKTIQTGGERQMALHSNDIDQVNYEHVLQIARERFANAADFTFIITGAIDEATLLPLLEQYIASLPSVGKKEKANMKVNDFAKGKKENTYQRAMEVPMVTNVFFDSGKMKYNLKNKLSFKLALNFCTCLGFKLKLNSVHTTAALFYLNFSVFSLER